MAQQTAVEWLEQHLKDLETKIFNFEISPLDSPAIRENLYKQAKQREKENIVTAWNDSKVSIMNGEQYYNETYKQ